MLGRDSSEFFEYDEDYSEDKKSEKHDTVLNIMWALFYVLSIISIIVFSVLYPSLKFPLEELSSTISNNKTIDSILSPAVHIEINKNLECNKPTSVILSRLKEQLNNNYVIQLNSHKLITGGSNARSKAGNFYLNDSTYVDLSQNETYFINGYQDMISDSGILSITLDSTHLHDENQIEIDSAFDITNWKNGTQLQTTSVLDQSDSNVLFTVIANEQNQPFIVRDDNSISFNLHKNTTNEIKSYDFTRSFVENTFYVVNTKDIKYKNLIYISYTEYFLMTSSDLQLSALTCE
ncbi:Apyrase [Entamoeba marina]